MPAPAISIRVHSNSVRAFLSNFLLKNRQLMIFVGGRKLAFSMLFTVTSPDYPYSYNWQNYKQPGDRSMVQVLIIALPTTKVLLNSKAHHLDWLETKYRIICKIRAY